MKKLIHLVLILSIFLYCAPKQEKVEKIIEDGVEVVINHLEPYKMKEEPSTLNLEVEFTIDTEKDEIAELGVPDIRSFDIDSEGNIYFLLSRENFVFKFNKDGHFITSFGKRGQGPGEINWPTSLRINNHDEIEVIDRLGRKFLIFRDDGNLIKEIHIKSITIQVITPLANGNYLIARRFFDSQGKYIYQFPLSICSSEFDEIIELDRRRIPRSFKINRGEGLPYVFIWAISDKNIYVGNAERGYEICIYNLNGKLLRKIKKEYKQVEVTEEFKKKIQITFGQLPTIEKIYFPKYMPPFQYFFTDDKGRLFVVTYEKGNNPMEYICDIFNSEDVFIGRKSLKGFAPYFFPDLIERLSMAKAKKNRLYCLSEKESGYKELVVYKMKWE